MLSRDGQYWQGLRPYKNLIHSTVDLENTGRDFAKALQYILGMGNTASSLTNLHEVSAF